MLAVAAEVGYSETAFLVPRGGGRFAVRYFSPLAEVPFCGHATIAPRWRTPSGTGPGALLLRHPGRRRSRSRPAPIRRGLITATLTSVAAALGAARAGRPRPAAGRAALGGRRPRPGAAAAGRVRRAPGTRSSPPRPGAAGRPGLRLRRARRADGRAGLDHGRPGVAGVGRTVFHARNPFPPGGVVEDPATGAAAAAFGGYLRELGLVAAAGHGHHAPGRRHGPAQRAHRRRCRPTPGSGIAVTGTAVAL